MQKKPKMILGVVAAAVAIAVLIPVVGFGMDFLKSAIRDSKPASYYLDAWGVPFPESLQETYSRKTEGRDWWGIIFTPLTLVMTRRLPNMRPTRLRRKYANG